MTLLWFTAIIFQKKRLLTNANLHILVQNTWKKYTI